MIVVKDGRVGEIVRVVIDLRICCIIYNMVKSESHSVVSNFLLPHGLHSLWNFLGQNTGMDSFSLLQGIFPTQGLNPGLTHCRRILYQLSHRGKPRNTVVGNLSLLEDLPNPGIEPVSLTSPALAGVTLSYFFKKHLLIINYVNGECSIQHIIVSEKHYKPVVTIIL